MSEAVTMQAPNSLLARRSKMLVVPTLSLGTPKQMPKEDCTPMQKRVDAGLSPVTSSVTTPNTAMSLRPALESGGGIANRLCMRRGVEQLQIRAPQLTEEKPLAILGLGAEPSSPAPSIGSLSTASFGSHEPSSPSGSDLSMDEWGFDTDEFLGAGSMASVYKVTRRSDGQRFAAKHVHSEDPEPMRQLREEHGLLMTLCHDNVVSATQLYERRVDAWLCMEFCRGGSVEDHVVRHGAFSELTVTTLSRQLLEGMNYLHQRRVVHRDLKPMNLLLTSEDATTLKIGDFGSASQLDSKKNSSGMLSARGTQLYSAPELRFGLEWNERVDVWACGLCIYFMARSQQPFNSASRQNARLLQQGCLPPTDWGAMSKPLVNLVRQCLAVPMHDRPSPMELLEHRLFSDLEDSERAASGDTAEGSCIADSRDPAVTSLASCGLIMRDLHTSLVCSARQRSARQQHVRDLATQRYWRLEGMLPASAKAWTSPL